jgi:type II secretory pathway predicted ATPase ExeA
MYEAYFGLGRRPFSSVPRVDHYFPAAVIEAARQTLIRCVERAEGVGIVIGPSGTGKTLLCQLLAEHLKESFQVVVLLSGRLSSPRALLQAILFELGQPYRGMDEGELRLALVDYLGNSEVCPHGMVLIVDEAHTLPLRLMEEIRMIANLVSGGRPQVRPVLVGGSILEERLGNPKLDSFNQRIVARCYLESFDRSETREYIRAQLSAAGAEPDEIISPEACHAVHQATDGIPRLVSQLCDHALVLAYAAGHCPVDRAGVEEAWADLQQLPTPWNADRGRKRGSSGVIEFGGLDDGPDDSETADDNRPATISLLRVAPGSDEADDDPVEQVTGIQRALDELDDDFQPVGSIGTEIELFFDPVVDPFGEDFEEEEVIVDNLAQPRSQVQKPEEGTLAASEPEADSPDFAADEPLEEEPEPVAGAAMEVGPSGSLDESLDELSDELAHELADEPDEEPAEVAGALPPSETIAWQPRPAVQPTERITLLDPGPILIVEEGHDDEESAIRPPAAAKRREYKRLFTTLRGSR